jgi:hypothetical protein
MVPRLKAKNGKMQRAGRSQLQMVEKYEACYMDKKFKGQKCIAKQTKLNKNNKLTRPKNPRCPCVATFVNPPLALFS